MAEKKENERREQGEKPSQTGLKSQDAIRRPPKKRDLQHEADRMLHRSDYVKK